MQSIAVVDVVAIEAVAVIDVVIVVHVGGDIGKRSGFQYDRVGREGGEGGQSRTER